MKLDFRALKTILLRVQSESYFFDIARGVITGHDIVRVGAVNESVGLTRAQIWPQEGTYTYLDTAKTIKVVSDNADDDKNGTGARKVTIVGLTSDWAEVEEVITLNGTSEKKLDNDLIRINAAYVSESGSGGGNAGKITIKTNAGVVQSVIMPGQNQSENGLFAIRKGCKAFIHAVLGSNAGVDPARYFISIRPFGKVFRYFSLNVGPYDDFYYSNVATILLEEKTDIAIMARKLPGSVSTVPICGRFVVIRNWN